MTFSHPLQFTQTKYHDRVPDSAPNFNKLTLNWWVKTTTIQSTPRMGLYGATGDDNKVVILFQIYEGNLFYSGIINDYNYEGFFEYYQNDDTSYLNNWNNHVIVFDTSETSYNKIKWKYNDVDMEFVNHENFTFPNTSSYSGPANSMRIWFGIFEGSTGDAIADVEYFDGVAGVGNNYGNNGFKLTFNTADINTEFDEFGAPKDIDDPYGSAKQVKHGWLADVSGTGNHWFIDGL